MTMRFMHRDILHVGYVYKYIRSMHTWVKVSVFKSGRNGSRYREVVIKGVKGGGETFEYNTFIEILF